MRKKLLVGKVSKEKRKISKKRWKERKEEGRVRGLEESKESDRERSGSVTN